MQTRGTSVRQEQAAFDALPPSVRRAVIDARCNVCCTKVLEYLQQGHQVRDVIDAIIKMDAQMVAIHHQQLASGTFARLN